MRDIKKEWELAKEEFVEKAFRRFDIFAGDATHSPVDNADIEKFLSNIELLPLPELVAHDLEFYENPHLMWESEFGGEWFTVPANLKAWLDDNRPLRRKASADLQFDLKRAEEGDVVEYEDLEGTWKRYCGEKFDNAKEECGYIVFENQASIHSNQLRMKYPQRINK